MTEERRGSRALHVGEAAPEAVAMDIDGCEFSVTDYRGQPLVLAFFRYASCPMCLLRVAELARWTPDLRADGAEVVAVFHSPPGRIRRHMGRMHLPMRIVADPSRALYAAFGVGRSWPGVALSLLRPTFTVDFVRAALRGHLGGAIDGEFARMPADFVIGPDGRIAAAHYGSTIGDHMRLEVIQSAVRARTFA